MLVILCGRRKAQSRIAAQGATVFSDGAASCVVSSEHGRFEILANESRTNTYLVTVERTPQNAARHLEVGLRDLKDVADRVYARVALDPEKIRTLFGTNGSLVYLHLMAQAARLSSNRIYDEDVARLGHVHSCDNLIGLKNFADANRVSAGDHYLLLAWSPYIVSASLLRCVS